ncbi:MAG: methyltransferase domain-containing protein [Planctomycetota bacterium]|nr:methyltransferase domain-containing protein [Planctomycetota bacterium]
MYRIGDVRFDLVRCSKCSLVYVNPRPTSATLGALYDDPEYYTHGYNLGVETENYFTRKGELIAQYETTIAEYERETNTKAGDLFELGSAGGFFLEAGRRRGWRVKGVELSEPAARYSVHEFGLDIHRGLLDTAPYASATFDMALADNVLEHTLRPDEVLARLKDILRPGGHLIVIVPAYVNSAWFRGFQSMRALLPRRLLGRHVLALLKFEGDDAGAPYHILEFDRATLTRLVREAGFEIVKTENSVPLPAELFKDPRPTLRKRFLRVAFRSLDRLMRMGLVPGARVRIVARRPR